ncbi:DNA topoisomerase I, mitochondrial-like [Lineus longissimus]|uniref:DNA topoisomerase I, mitochondrial-like n=1 Tax=Lineus longissimus TaxID=88925 RepID=UPI00315C8DC9
MMADTEENNAPVENGMDVGPVKIHNGDGHKDKVANHHKSGSHREKSSSSSKHSSSKPKDGSSSHNSSSHKSSSSKHRDGERHKDGSSKHSSSSSSKLKEGSSSDRKSSSHSSSDKHRDSSSSKHKEHSKSSSSSSSSRPKEGSSSISKHSSEHRDKDKHKSSSSSSKDKDRSSSSSRHSSSRPKEGSSSKSKEGSSNSSLERKSREDAPKKPQMTIKVESVPVKSESMDTSPVKKEPLSPRKHSPVKVKYEAAVESEDDVPLSARKKKVEVKKEKKRQVEDSDDEPLDQRAKKSKKTPDVKRSVKKREADYDDDDMPLKKKAKVTPHKTPNKTPVKQEGGKKRVKKEGEQDEVWKWWEEERRGDGVKWNFLEHKGPIFAPDYEPLPSNVHFYYDGKKMRLCPEAEEVATFYGRMLDNDYTTKDVFNKNFFTDWRKMMKEDEKKIITDLKKCNFREIDAHFKQKSEERKAMSKEEKKAIKEENERLLEEYGFCSFDGHREKIGNFRIEPPGLFRGRGDHPKQGMLKRRTVPEDVIINCSKNSDIPVAPAGHRWKEVRHDNTVTWLCSWNENIQGAIKYIMLNANSRIKGEKDWMKYETARRLHKCVDKIRAQYREDWKSKEMRIRQRAVALYFIDKLALRAGNEKEEGESADTVGCCSLRVEHLSLHEHKNGKDYVVEFDFLGKDSIRYQNAVAVEKRVFKNLQMFTDQKAGEDDVFDRLNTSILNKYLHELMDGLTAKVFRTYNASRTLQEQLDLLTQEEDLVPAKLLSYNRANRAVAVLCNHQRAVPKNFSKQMENLQIKIDAKLDTIKEAKRNVKQAKVDFKNCKNEKNKSNYDRKKKQLERLEEQLTKLEVLQTDKDENKEIALGTSKLNYLDPRISVAWCKKWEVPIEKIYNKTQRDKFKWAINMVGPEFVF